MSLSRLITGLVLLALGMIFITLAIFHTWWMLFYGIPLFILGIAILLYKNEDKIEERKDLKEKRYTQ
jgi:uncharacterized membrane protein